MTVRLSVLVALLATGSVAFAQSETERFSRLIKRSESAQSPGLAILMEFWREEDIDLSRSEIRAAIARAGLDPDSQLATGMSKLRRITKRGSTVTFERDREDVVSLGGGYLKLKPKVSFRIEAGYIRGLSRADQKRLADADRDYGYVHLSDLKGVKVGESRHLMVSLYELYQVKENGFDIVHGRGGVRFWTDWRRVEIPRRDDSEDVSSNSPAPKPRSRHGIIHLVARGATE